MATPFPRRGSWLLLALGLIACRKGTDSTVGGLIPVVASPAGTQGCGPSTPGPATLVPVYASAAIGPKSQIVAAAGAEILYFTGADGSIHELALGGGPPVDTVLVAPGVIEASFLQTVGIGAPAELSGITIFDDQFLIVAEHASNTLLSVRRDVADTVAPLAGLPLAAGGFADGPGGSIRFHFTDPVTLLADVSGSVFVGDTENHALRRVQIGPIPFATTITGNGAPGAGEGDLAVTRLDTPSGMAASCSGELLLVESGRAGAGGHRLLALAIGAPSIFGGIDGSALTVAGDGTAETLEGVGPAARLDAPEGLVATQDGQLFWVDSGAGILRRFDLGTGLCDCPLFASCADAVTAGGSFDGTHFSLAVGDSGTLYVLEADGATLHRVDP